MGTFFKKFLCGFFLLICINTTNAQTAIPPLPELKFSEIVHKDLFLGDRWSYMERGSFDKPALIALHGAGGNSMDWRFQFSGLSNRFRVIAWNAPGYFLSDGFRTEFPSCKDYADALLDFIQSLGLDKVYLVGNSFGSRVGQCFALHYPEKLLKMVFVGPSAFQSNLTDSTKNQIIQARIEQIKDGGFAFGNKRVSALMGRNPSPELIKIVSESMRATNRRAFLQVTTHLVFAEGYSSSEIAFIQIPVLLIAGELDKVSPIEKNAMILKQVLPHSELVILNDIGHLPHLEAPTRVNSLIRNYFLKRL
jgi:pimeloyl-ACP methyl ester carboxylesterase